MTGLIRNRAKAGMTIPGRAEDDEGVAEPRSAGNVPSPSCLYAANWAALSAMAGRQNASLHRRRRSRRDDGRAAVRPRRGADHRAREAWRLPPRFPRRHRPSLDAADLLRARAARPAARAAARQGARASAPGSATRESRSPTSPRFDPRWNFIAMMPQWDFLDFVADEARLYPAFRAADGRRGARAWSEEEGG